MSQAPCEPAIEQGRQQWVREPEMCQALAMSQGANKEQGSQQGAQRASNEQGVSKVPGKQ